jgi:hypothetical protein
MQNGFPLWLICLGDAGAAFLQRIIFFDTGRWNGLKSYVNGKRIQPPNRQLFIGYML